MSLEERVERFDSIAAHLIDLIPSKFYFTDRKEFCDQLDIEKHEILENGAVTKSAKKALNQKLKLNALVPKVSEIVEGKTKNVKGGEDSDEEKDEVWGRKIKILQMKNNKAKGNRMLELQLKLKMKIDEMKKNRNADSKSSKKNNRESKAERRNKNRNKPGGKQKGFGKKPVENGVVNGEKAVESKEKKCDKNSSLIYNKEGKLIYSKFDFVTPPLINNEKKEKKVGKIEKLKKSLKAVRKENEKVEELKNAGKFEEAQKLKSKSKWRNAMLRSEGKKVKDNPKLIETSLKRKQKIKRKNTVTWNERTAAVDKKKEARQEKRTSNLQKRKDAKREKKINRSKRKGRVVFQD